MNKIFCASLAFLISVFILFESNTKNNSEWPEKENSLNIKFSEDLRIKSEDKNQNYLFFAQGVEADSSGNIYVMDSHDFKILKFDKNGNFLTAIGKKGQGPGEFEAPSNILIDNQDNMYVQDVMRMALVVFDRNGKFIKNIKGTGILYWTSRLFVAPDLSIICGYQPLTSIGEDNLYKISKFDRDLNFLSDIYERKGSIFIYRLITETGPFIMQAPRYTPSVIWTMSPKGQVYVGYNDSYHIMILSAKGKFINEIKRKCTPEKVLPDERQQILADYEKRSKDISKIIEIPRVKPCFQRLFIVENYLFVLIKRVGKNYYFDVFDENGMYVDETTLAFLPIINKSGFIYTLSFKFEGEIDPRNIIETEIIRYKIIRSSPKNRP